MNVDYVPVADLTTAAEMIARQKEIRRRQEEAAKRIPAQAAEPGKVQADMLAETSVKVRMVDPLAHLPRSIIRRVAAQYGLTYADIVGRDMFSHVVHARHEAIRAVHEAHPTYALNKLGRIFDRDHTSIINALRGPKASRGKTKQPTGALNKDQAPPQEIIADVARKYSIDAREVTGRGCREVALNARSEAIAAVSAAHPEMTRRQIGMLFDGRDPTTIVHILKSYSAARTVGGAA